MTITRASAGEPTLRSIAIADVLLKRRTGEVTFIAVHANGANRRLTLALHGRFSSLGELSIESSTLLLCAFWLNKIEVEQTIKRVQIPFRFPGLTSTISPEAVHLIGCAAKLPCS